MINSFRTLMKSIKTNLNKISFLLHKRFYNKTGIDLAYIDLSEGVAKLKEIRKGYVFKFLWFVQIIENRKTDADTDLYTAVYNVTSLTEESIHKLVNIMNRQAYNHLSNMWAGKLTNIFGGEATKW